MTKQQIDSTSYYSNLANNPKTSTSLVQSYVFFNKAFEKNIRSKDTISAINSLRQLSIIQFGLGDYYGSETSAVEALKLLSSISDKKILSQSKVGLYNQLGRIYNMLMEYNEAIKYYKKALKHTTNQGYINIIRNNIGLIYLDQSNYTRAESEFLEVYKNSIPLKDKKQTARALDNLGLAQLKLNKQEALHNLQDALQIRLKIDDSKGLYSSYKNLSTYFKAKDDKNTANHYAKKAYEAAKKLNSPSFVEDALSNWITLNPTAMVLEYQKLKDSIDKAKPQRLLDINNDLQAKFIAVTGNTVADFKENAKKLFVNSGFTSWFSKDENTGEKWNYRLARLLDKHTCTYCNREYIFVYRNPSGSGKSMVPQFDHWFAKTDFPLLGISFYNLIPSCSTCNTIKSSTELNLKDHLHPYLDSNISSTYNFSYSPISISENKIVFKNSSLFNTKGIDTVRALNLPLIYRGHSSKELQDLIDLRFKYSDNYLNILLEKTFGHLDVPKEEIYRLIFGIELEEDKYHKRVFSKFKNDIIKELLSIKN
ncbi:tetratricopeptide repeat protein [Flavobacteriaceae bacterium GSB9]|nr:tetratricopeptide repeat protein [Flavobacteriaceae bacterium GSB9]